TPIQQALAPFNGTFNPQQALSTFIGLNSAGTWQLIIENNPKVPGKTITPSTATLTSWTLNFTQAQAGTGLGEPVSDQATVGFRLFNQDPLSQVAKNNWTPVGPIANNDAGNAGQITTVVTDTSDPSGNTVYAAGPHTGIWKTTNFLTTDAQ